MARLARLVVPGLPYRVTRPPHGRVPRSRRLGRSARRSPASQLSSQVRNNDAYSGPGSGPGGAVALSRTYTNNGLNQHIQAGAATFTYDARGNLTGDGTSTYTYEVDIYLVSAKVGGQMMALRYDPLGGAAQGSGGAQRRWNGCGGRLYEVTGSTSGAARTATG